MRIGVETAAEFFRRPRKRAQMLDRGEKIATEMRLTFEDPADFLRALATQRVRVLHAVRKKPAAGCSDSHFAKAGEVPCDEYGAWAAEDGGAVGCAL